MAEKRRWMGRRRGQEADLEKEVRSHLDLEAEEQSNSGATSHEARDAARRAFGSTAFVKEDVRQAWGWAWLDQLAQDLRYGLRQLWRNPGSTGVAVLTLAIGIGANTTIFSWIREVLLNPLPGAAQPERVVALEMLTPSQSWVPTSYPDFRDIRDHVKLSEGMSVAQPMGLAVGTEQNADYMWGELVSGNFFDLLRVKPELGRFFTGAELDEAQNAHAVAVISDSLWRRRYQSNPEIAGAVVRINQHPYTIIGVAPETFHGSMPGLDFDLWAPATMYGQLTGTGDWMLKDRKTRMFRVLTRLAPGVRIEQATDEVKSITARLAEMDAYTNGGMSATLLPMWKSHYGVQDSLRAPLGFGMGVCGVVLLIVCANVANLLLARATSRRKEFSIRLALGAPRWRLIRQLLTETLLLAIAGGLFGLIATAWLVDAMRWLRPELTTPALVHARLDLGVLLFTAGLAFSVTLIAGLAPALHASRENVNEMLKESGRSGTAGARSQRLRGFLVTSEVALAVVALIGAGLFVKSFGTARGMSPGFDAERVALGRFSLSTAGYDRNQADSFCRRLREKLERQPGVTAVSYADTIPLGFQDSWEDLKIEGYVPAPNENMKIFRNLVAPGYFRAMKIPLLEGRDFDLRDDLRSKPVTPVMIVTREFARRFFAGQNPIGRKVYGWGNWFTVVGEVEDSKYHQVTENVVPYFYASIRQIYRPEMGLTFFVRTSGPVSESLTAIRREAQGIDPALPLFDARPLNEYIAASLFAQKIAASLLGVLGSVALLLAAVGLYGVMSYSVAQRTNEIGIRMTLGAQRRDVLRMIVWQGLKLALPGLLVGALVAVGLARVASAALVAVSPADPSVYAGAAAFAILIALASTVIPAWRAMRVDPMVALRYE
jgi:predicted permease